MLNTPTAIQARATVGRVSARFVALMAPARFTLAIAAFALTDSARNRGRSPRSARRGGVMVDGVRDAYRSRMSARPQPLGAARGNQVA